MKRCAAVLFMTAGLFVAPAVAHAATITPDIVADDYTAAPDGSCSLREAVQAASDNAAFSTCPAGDAGTDTIVLTSPSATPYVLTLGADDEDANAQGDLDYEDGGPIVIRSAVGSIVRATVTDRVIDLEGGGNLTLEGISLDDGDVTAVAADEDSRGGNLRATGTNTLTLNDVTVRDGNARDGGGGLYASTGTTLTVNDSTIVNNDVEGASGGSTGGGVLVLGSQQAIFNRSEILGNDLDTSALGNMKGGGIRASVDDGAVLAINDTAIVGNEISHGGVQPADQVFGGGASIASQGVIRRSLIEGNSAAAAGDVERGGGLHVDGGLVGEVLTVVNTTFYDNEIGDAGNDGAGGAAYITGQVAVDFNHVSVFANTATDSTAADGIERGAAALAAVNLRGSLAGNTLGVNLCEGDVNSQGYNVTAADDTDCDFGPTDRQVTPLNVVAGDPVDNGGSVETIALLGNSPARDFVPAAACAAEGTDARGYARPLPVGGACDAGAYEIHTCDGTTIINAGPFVACPVPPQPASPVKKAKKCKKKKGKKAKKKKRCKKKKKKRR